MFFQVCGHSFAVSVLRCVFFNDIGLNEEMTPESEVGCAENIVNTNFREVSLFHVFSELDDIQSTFGFLFGSFWGTLGSLFLICEGPGSRSEI